MRIRRTRGEVVGVDELSQTRERRRRVCTASNVQCYRVRTGGLLRLTIGR